MRKGTVVLVVVLLLALAGTASAAFPETIPLPDEFNPEGVVMGYGTEIYVGSLGPLLAGEVNGGAIYRADVRTGAGELMVPSEPGRVAVGLDFDRSTGLLYVAGGPTGMAHIYDTRTGEEVGSHVLTSEPGMFVNDVIVTQDAAFFTESKAPVLYRYDRVSGAISTIELKNFPHNPDPAAFNSNGIVATPGERYLIIANSDSATLHRVDQLTGDTVEIDLGGDNAASADGLVRVGNRIYIVQNFLNQIKEVKLQYPYVSGEVIGDPLTNTDFDIPTTATSFGKSLYAVNARFATPGAVDFDIVRVDR